MKNPSAMILCLTLLGLTASDAAPLGTAFTYQGRLSDGTNPANGRYDFTFTLYDDPASAKIIAGPLTNSRLNVVDGLFTVALDFRADVFGGQARWLEIGVRSSSMGPGPFTPLSPRQQLTPTPQALYAPNAGDSALFNGQSATFYAPGSSLGNYVAKAGDTMTGQLVVPANSFRAGTDQLVLTGGNVGIGTTSPGALLGLEGGQILVHARGSHTAGAWLSLENTSTDGKRWDFISTGADNGGGAGNLLFRQAAVGSVLTLTPGGYAGLGTLSPIAKLHVMDQTGAESTLLLLEGRSGVGVSLELVNNDSGARWHFTSTGTSNDAGVGSLLFRPEGKNSVMTLTSAGYVGVGTITPANRFHVAYGFNYGPQPVLRVDQGNGTVAQFHQASLTSSNFIVCTHPIPPNIPEAVVFRVNGFGDVYGQSFNPSSDRGAKENLSRVDPSEVLEKVTALPISKWNFKGDETTPHFGPMAQDFHAAFGLGTDDKHIATVDADGVALAAIQGLNQKMEAENAELKKRVAQLEQLVRNLTTKGE
ncbi:MAG TPA: tail fiber domain-containing protein [Verrucomicrobiae bacterium]